MPQTVTASAWVGNPFLSEFKERLDRLRDALLRWRGQIRTSSNAAVYRNLARQMPNSAVIMLDQHLRYTFTDGPFLKRFGPQYDNIVGKSVHEALDPQLLELMLPMFKRALSGEYFEYERETSAFTYHAFFNPLLNSAGRVIGVMVIIHDNSVVKALEHALRQSKRRYQALVELAPVGIVEMDMEGRVIHRNSRLYELTGRTPEQLQTQPFEAVHPADRDRVVTILRTMLKERKPPPETEYRCLHPDGKVIWVSNCVTLLIDDAGAANGYIIVFNDITEYKRLKLELRENERRLRLITDNIQDLITQTDVEDRILYASPSSRVILGMDLRTWLGAFGRN